MTIIKAVILGLVQGLTEFLPVSSSGHLVLFGHLLEAESQGVTFEVMLHFGTLLSILVWARHELVYLVRGGLALVGVGKKRRDSYICQGVDYRKLALFLIIGTIPAAIMGLLLEETFEKLFSSVRVVGVALFFTGALIWITTRVSGRKKDLEKMSLLDSLLIGIAQGVAMIPGISRSGMTISTGLLLGIKRELAVKFSFLLAIPVIMGATLMKTVDITSFVGADFWSVVGVDLLPVVAGSFTAFLSGLVAIRLLLGAVRKGQLKYFAYYCWLLGGSILLITFF